MIIRRFLDFGFVDNKKGFVKVDYWWELPNGKVPSKPPSTTYLWSGDQYALDTDSFDVLKDGTIKIRLDIRDAKGKMMQEEYYLEKGEKLIFSMEDANDEHLNGQCKECWPDGYKEKFLTEGAAQPCSTKNNHAKEFGS